MMALLAFAGNSILCRLALGSQLIDATSFTLIRLVCGAIMLMLIIVFCTAKPLRSAKGNWLSAFALFGYALAFSFAYQHLDTATGALILFGCVQISMIGIGLYKGHKLGRLEWFGTLVAVFGFVFLMLPAAHPPDLWGAVLMATSGIAWGLYSVRGANSRDALADTTGNFIRSVVFMLPVPLLITFLPASLSLDYGLVSDLMITPSGVFYALLSGALTSGVGYALWYAVLPALQRSQAAVLQLSVPLFAALGGVVLLNEAITGHFMICALIIFAGIAMVIYGKQRVPS